MNWLLQLASSLLRVYGWGGGQVRVPLPKGSFEFVQIYEEGIGRKGGGGNFDVKVN